MRRPRGGGPGSGPVGCKSFLKEFLPGLQPREEEKGLTLQAPSCSIGAVKAFYGNFLVVVKALTYLLMLGKEGIPQAAENAVLNANYMMHKLKAFYPMAYPEPCMHEFVMSAEKLKREKGVSAVDIAKALQDCGIHPPTMYFPLIVHEALMVEPTETESRETLDQAIEAFCRVWEKAQEEPEKILSSPHYSGIKRPDEVQAARKPVLRYRFLAGAEKE